jgi:hypothetical protein
LTRQGHPRYDMHPPAQPELSGAIEALVTSITGG